MLSEDAPPVCRKNLARGAWRIKCGGWRLLRFDSGRVSSALAAQGHNSRSTSPTATWSIWVSRRRSSGGMFRRRRLKHHMRKRWRIRSKRSLNEPILTPPDLQPRENTPRYGHKWQRQGVTCRRYRAAVREYAQPTAQNCRVAADLHHSHQRVEVRTAMSGDSWRRGVRLPLPHRPF
jgi:hypothetical protein